MGRSEPGGEKERELARIATMVIAAGRREGRQANDWLTFNEKRIKQAKTGLFIQNLCETEHPGDYERTGIFILESRRGLGRLYEMAPVRIVLSMLYLILLTQFSKIWTTVNFRAVFSSISRRLLILLTMRFC